MPREKGVEKLLLLLLQSHSSLNRLCLWSVQTYPWQSLWFPAERSAIVAGYQMLPHFAQVKDARAFARLQDLQSIPTTSYYHTVLFELDWTAIGLALTTGILKWVAKSIQEMLSTVYRLYRLPKHRIKTDFVQSRKRHGKVAASPDDASWERSRKTLSHSSLNRLCLWSVQTCPWQSLWFPTEPSAIVAGYQMLPHFAQAKDARAFARLQDLQSIPTTSYYHTVLVELDWTAIGLALTTGILRWVAKSIQDMLSTVYRLYPLSHFCQKIGLKLTSVQSRNGTRRLLHLLIMPREKEVEKLLLLLLLLQSHSSLNRLCLWSVQTYPWQSLWFPAERSAIAAGYQVLPHFAQAKDARASARLQDLQSIPTTSYYHTVLVELDWTAIGLALTTGILKWVAQSVQDMLSTVDRLYPFVRLLPKDRIKIDFVQSRNGTGRLLHLLIMPRETEVEKLLLLLLQSHSSLNWLCLWSVQTYPWQSLWFFLLSGVQLWLGTRCCLTLRK